MLLAQAQQLTDKLQELFPRWTPTQTEIEEWERVFLEIENYDDAHEALTRYWRSTKRLTPIPATFIAVHKGLLKDKGKDRKTDKSGNNGYLGFYLYRRDTDTKRPIYHSDPDKIRQQFGIFDYAEKLRQRFERIYGGQWQVIFDEQEQQQGEIRQVEDDIPF